MDKVMSTSATATGGRDGRVKLDDGKHDFNMALPKSLGGNGEGTNPEELFAMGYSSCFGQAVMAMAKKHGVDPDGSSTNAEVTLFKDDISFVLKVVMTVSLPKAASREEAEKVAEAAHEICPYSRATRGNVDVTVKVA